MIVTFLTLLHKQFLAFKIMSLFDWFLHDAFNISLSSNWEGEAKICVYIIEIDVVCAVP